MQKSGRDTASCPKTLLFTAFTEFELWKLRINQDQLGPYEIQFLIFSCPHSNSNTADYGSSTPVNYTKTQSRLSADFYKVHPHFGIFHNSIDFTVDSIFIVKFHNSVHIWESKDTSQLLNLHLKYCRSTCLLNWICHHCINNLNLSICSSTMHYFC